jgi:hypothetical protein
MTKFCNNALLEGGKSGEYGDCGLFIVNGIGLILIVCLFVFPLLSAKRNKKHFVLNSDRDNLDLKQFAMSSNYGRQLMIGKILYFLIIASASLVFVFSILEEVNGYAYIVNYLSVGLRVAGWVMMSFYIREFIMRRTRLLIGALCWGTSQVSSLYKI